jgi:SanA protein
MASLNLSGRNKINLIVFCLLLVAGVIVIQSKMISLVTQNKITNNVNHLPDYHIVVIPGAGTTTDPASPNYSFEARIKKTVELYQTGRINKIIVSGISNKMFYNEPNDMKNALIKYGVPAQIIYPDHGGVRTFMTVKRAGRYSGNAPFIIVSQRKQLERALYIARCLNVEATGLEADTEVDTEDLSDDVYEMVARVKCIAECIFNN